MSEHSDEELVERARRGDGAAIGELFSRYWRAARAAAFGVTGEFASAEDAASEGFRQALVGISGLRDPNRFGPWLRTIVVRKARQGVRSNPASTDALAEDLPDSNERPDNALERLELQVLIQQSVRQLPPGLREAVSLFYIEGYDSDSAARFLDIPAGTFRRRLHEGRKRLRSAARQIFQGSKSMNQEREREIEKLRSLIDNAKGGDPEPLFAAFRGALALRPPAPELIELIRRQMESANRPEAMDGGKDLMERAREAAQRFGTPSHRASDPNHPVGAVAAAIRQALPHFQDWSPDLGEAAAQLFGTREPRGRLQRILPPGFAEGREGAFLGAARAFLLSGENGPARTTYQALQGSAGAQSFRAGMNNVRISDVLDLTWMVAGPLELRSVQDLLERLSSTILPEAPVRFSNYEEPRYRSGLQLQVGDASATAAIGGVLAEWSGRPLGVDAAYVRIFLEPWATVQSGQVVEFDRGNS